MAACTRVDNDNEALRSLIRAVWGLIGDETAAGYKAKIRTSGGPAFNAACWLAPIEKPLS